MLSEDEAGQAGAVLVSVEIQTRGKRVAVNYAGQVRRAEVEQVRKAKLIEMYNEFSVTCFFGTKNM